jgi:hypothetical protein
MGAQSPSARFILDNVSLGPHNHDSRQALRTNSWLTRPQDAFSLDRSRCPPSQRAFAIGLALQLDTLHGFSGNLLSGPRLRGYLIWTLLQ